MSQLHNIEKLEATLWAAADRRFQLPTLNCVLQTP
jgi:hypothetical protein